MTLVTGFQDVQDSVLIKVADEQYGHIPIVAELLDRFTTLADNWSELNKQAMDAVKAKNDALNLNRNAMYVISRSGLGEDSRLRRPHRSGSPA